jgi:hypothetical protein
VGKAVAISLLVLALQPRPVHDAFTTTLPAGVPDGHGWEKIAGNLELDSPRLRVQYEFYVNPARPALYELVRYRVTLPDGSPDARDYPPVEKLQWHAHTQLLRRFECDPALDASAPCRWRELARDSGEYKREVLVVLWLYGLHQRERDRGPAAETPTS